MATHRDLVVIASSFGGPEVLAKILQSLPGDFPAAILIAQHLAPDSPRRLARILSKCGPLMVQYASGYDEIEVGKVFLAPPDLHMVVRSLGHLAIEYEEKVHFARPAADPLFISAAEVYGPRAIAVVLTGGDGDGSRGLHAVTTAGGVGIVQSPEEARDPEMPLSALAVDSPQYVASASEIGPLLIKLTSTSFYPTS